MALKTKLAIVLGLAGLILLGCCRFYNDDEFSRWYHYNVAVKLMDSTRSPNVAVKTDMADIKSLNRKRTVRIYTPSSYDQSDKHYPVIYMFDGGRLFDNKTTGPPGEEGIDEILDKAISEGGREVIVVALDASMHRATELNPYDDRNQSNNESIKFMDYVAKELKPMIDREYRTLPDRHNTGIMGASFGGLFSFYTVMHYSDVFAKAGVLSPSFFCSEKEVYELPRKCTNKDMMIYMNVGSNELKKMIVVMEQMTQTLKAAGWNDSNLRTKIYENGGHEPKVWADGFSNAYQWFFNES